MAETIHIVDPVLHERRRIADALKGELAVVRNYDSAEQFLHEVGATSSGCMIVPIDLAGMGLRALIEEIRRRNLALAVIVLGRDSEFAAAVELVRWGAFDFLEHPFSDRTVRSVVRRAIGTGP